jgi:predicted dehydrogenase
VEWLLSTAWVHPGPDCPPDRVEIFGSEGSAELEVGSRIDVFGATHRRIELTGDDDPLRTELECFVEGIRTGKSQSPVSPKEALVGLKIAERIMEALRTP